MWITIVLAPIIKFFLHQIIYLPGNSPHHAWVLTANSKNSHGLQPDVLQYNLSKKVIRYSTVLTCRKIPMSPAVPVNRCKNCILNQFYLDCPCHLDQLHLQLRPLRKRKIKKQSVIVTQSKFITYNWLSNSYQINQTNLFPQQCKSVSPVNKSPALWLLPDVMVSTLEGFCQSDQLHAKGANASTLKKAITSIYHHILRKASKHTIRMKASFL